MACQCGECRLITEGTAPFYTPAQAQETRHQPYLLGLFTRERWHEHAPLYIFRCRSCEQVRYSFPCHATKEWFVIPHFHCDWCVRGLYIIIDARVYEELGVDDPPTGWSHFIAQAANALTVDPPPCVRRAGSHP